MLLSEMVELLKDTSDKEGDCDITAGQMRTAEGTTILTLVIPYRRILRTEGNND